MPRDTVGLPGRGFTLRVQFSPGDYQAFAEDNMVSWATKGELGRPVVKLRYLKSQT